MAKAIEKNLESGAMDEDDDGEDDDADDAPIFTPELARLKAKEQGKPVPDDDDMEMEADDEDGGNNKD